MAVLFPKRISHEFHAVFAGGSSPSSRPQLSIMNRLVVSSEIPDKLRCCNGSESRGRTSFCHQNPNLSSLQLGFIALSTPITVSHHQSVSDQKRSKVSTRPPETQIIDALAGCLQEAARERRAFVAS